MEPLDPKLARLVHDGMVQAVPGPEVEDRVLLGLLARLPRGGPPDGDGNGMPHGGEGASAAGTAGATGAAAGGKAWVLAAVLGVAAVTGAAVLGGRRDSQETTARDGAAAATQTDPAAEARRRSPSAAEAASTHQEDATPHVPDPGAASLTVTPRDPASTSVPSSVGERARPPTSPSRRSTVDAAIDRSTPDSTASEPLTSDDLAAEIQQIAAADRALARGELRRALELAREHAAAHPHGQLAIERTAIELGARCQLGEAGAVEAAATFLREHADAPAAAKVRTRCAAEHPE